MPASRTAKTVLAILLMLLFIASLGIYGWASGKAAAIVGPSHLAAAADGLFVYSGNDWPMMLALTDDGKLWGVQSNGRGQSADVLIYDPEHGAVARIALPEDAYPTDIVSLGASLIVSDMDGFRLYRIDAATYAVSDFGDSDLSGILRDAQQSRQAYKARMTQMIAAMIVFGVLMIGAAIWATPAEKRWTRPNFAAPLAATATAAPDIKGIYWLKRNRNMDRLLTWAPVVLYGMLIVLGVLMFNLFATVDTTLGEHPSAVDLTTFTEFKHSMLLIMGFFAGIPILIHLGMQNMKRQLGTDGRRLYVRNPNGRELSFAPEQLVYGNRHIQYQDLIFPTQTNKGQTLYDPGEVGTYIAPLLQQAKKLSALELLKYQFKYMEPVTMFTLAYIATTIGVAFITGLWRNFLH